MGDHATAIHYAQYCCTMTRCTSTYRRLMAAAHAGGQPSRRFTRLPRAPCCSSANHVEPALETQQAYAQLLEMAIPGLCCSQPPQAEASILRLAGRQTEWRTLRAALAARRSRPTAFRPNQRRGGHRQNAAGRGVVDLGRAPGAWRRGARAYAAGQGLAYTPVI
ncbi:MAG: hypothetical protein R2911_10980 [Caldilineaceae bacterium]